MTLFLYQKLNSQIALTFSKKKTRIKEQHNFLKKQVIFFFIVVFGPMIDNNYLKRILLANFTTVFLFSFTFLLTFNVKCLL